MNILEYGFEEKMLKGKVGGIPARIIATYRDRYEIVSNNGKAYAQLKSGSYYDNPNAIYPTIGDFVLVEWNDSGDSRILETLKRKSSFSRANPSSGNQREQLVAANFDYVFIIQSLNNDYNLRRMERYLALAWNSGAIPVILLTKSDLVENYSQILFEIESVAIGVDICVVSSKTGQGIEQLSKYCKPGNTVVFLGSSGVGKSTLVNTLVGKEVMVTQEIREDDSRGRHTTTNRELFMLDNGAMIIDTPGMRELGMWNVSSGFDKTFEDIEELTSQCKFSNCTHTNEPGCAILNAIENADITQERFKSYIKLKNEAKYANDSASYLREKKQKFKDIAKYNKNNSRII